jgi:hypothetical protein
MWALLRHSPIPTLAHSLTRCLGFTLAAALYALKNDSAPRGALQVSMAGLVKFTNNSGRRPHFLPGQPLPLLAPIARVYSRVPEYPFISIFWRDSSSE